MALNIGLASLAAALTDRENTPYFVPRWWQSSEGVPVRIAGHFGLGTAVDLSLFWQVWLLLSKHPPLDVGEYYEAGITSLLFYMVGVLVWLERADLRRRRSSPQVIRWNWVVRGNSCCSEERLAAVGRFLSAIALEIRNPVARIASSIATAKQLSRAEREEMFEIASVEANRLSQLTTEFLNDARPRPLHPEKQGRELVLAANETGRVRFLRMLPKFCATRKQQGNP